MSVARGRVMCELFDDLHQTGHTQEWALRCRQGSAGWGLGLETATGLPDTVSTARGLVAPWLCDVGGNSLGQSCWGRAGGSSLPWPPGGLTLPADRHTSCFWFQHLFAFGETASPPRPFDPRAACYLDLANQRSPPLY